MTIDPRLQDDVMNFLMECERNLPYETCNPVLDVTAKVGKLPEPDSLGVCFVYDDHKRVIVIAPNTVESPSRRVVIFHEMAHCVLGMDHFDDGVDIMNSYEHPFKTQYIKDNWDYFTTQVFKRVN
jgi:Zn-dependent peptidase ImmA (M78 family)